MIIIFILTDDDLKKLKKKDSETFKKLYNENKREIYNFYYFLLFYDTL